METILTLFKLALLFFSLAGYFFWLGQRFSIPFFFTPAVAISGITLALYAAGLLNLLPYAVGALALWGLFQLRYAWSFFQKPPLPEAENRFSPKALGFSLLLFFLLAALALLYFRGKVLSHIDNYTHWGLIVRDMLLEDALPSFRTRVIEFKTYPPGTALFLYYVCSLTGSSDCFMMLGQFLILLSFLYSLLAFVRRKNLWTLALVAAAAWYFLNGNDETAITELTVDTVLALAALCSFAWLYHWRDRLSPTVLWVSCLLGCELVLIKNSGLYFWGLSAVVLLFFLRSRGAFSHLWKPFCALTLGGPLLTIFLWRQHTQYVFTDAAAAPHSLSLEYYQSVLEKLDLSGLPQSFQSFLGQVFNLSNPALWLMALTLALTIGFWFARKRQSPAETQAAFRLWLFSLGSYGLYVAGEFLVGVFSVGSLSFGLYHRYHLTMVFYLYGIWLVYFLDKSAQLPRLASFPPARGLCLLSAAALLWLPFTTPPLRYSPYEERKRMDVLASQYHFGEDSMVIYSSDLCTGFIQRPENNYYVARYVFQVDLVNVVTQERLLAMNREGRYPEIDNCKWLVVLQRDPVIDAFLETETCRHKWIAIYPD